MAYSVYLGSNRLPVPPEKITYKIGNKNETVDTINFGEVLVSRKRGLGEISFSALIPNVDYPFSSTDGGPETPGGGGWADYLLDLKENETAFQFIINRRFPNGDVIFDTNLTVKLEDFEFTDDAEEGFDTNVTITLKEFQDWGTTTAKIKTSKKSSGKKKKTVKKKKARKSKNTRKTTYTVKAGDRYWKIAKKFYGDGSLYPTIKKANKAKSNMIHPGDKLVIPERKS